MSKYKVGDKVRVLDKDTLLERQLKYIGLEYIVREIEINPLNILYELDNQSIPSFYKSELELVEPESDDILIGLKDSLDKIKSSRKILGAEIDVETDLEELIELVEDWSINKGLDETEPIKQFAKLIEETGELASGLLKGKEEVVKDSLGDILVVLIILHQQLGYTLDETLAYAWNEIKDRKGEMKNGVFVKEEDL